jgi:hypothetical protein
MSSDYEQQRAEKESLWQSRMDAWKHSRQGIKEYCDTHNLNYHQFKYWQKRLIPESIKQRAESTDVTDFVELRPQPLHRHIKSFDARLEFQTDFGANLVIQGDFDATSLKDMLSVFKELSC